jgi:serine/threonine protein kinase HipA of HipAB toxin-antitoxin module
MPDRHVVEAFAAAVESNDHVGAIERFYAADASTRENQNEPRKGRDVLAVPATGAYTLTMASTYNGVPRPAVVMVSNGDAHLIRRRETQDDLLRTDSLAK